MKDRQPLISSLWYAPPPLHKFGADQVKTYDDRWPETPCDSGFLTEDVSKLHHVVFWSDTGRTPETLVAITADSLILNLWLSDDTSVANQSTSVLITSKKTKWTDKNLGAGFDYPS